MKTEFLNPLSRVLTSCLVVMGVVTIAFGDDGPTVGVVRISDSQPAPPLGPIPEIGNGYGQYTTPNGGYIVHEGPAYTMTGNPVHDSLQTSRMKLDSWRTRHRLEQEARSGLGGNGFRRRSPFGSQNQYVNPTPPTMLPHERRLAELVGKFGYFHPTGCGGGGCPPVNTYHLVYPANPRYFDKRDGKLYAAQGYGVPMAVPLAPNVRHSYNYGWGIPSSRLTPISRVRP